MSDPDPGSSDPTPRDGSGSSSEAQPVFVAGETVPGLSSWVLDRRLGGGGFGEVWLARHAWDGAQLPRAVKFCTNPTARHRLVTHEKNVVLRVMKYAGRHPNIVPLLDCNLDGNVPWLMYEFVEGGTLAGVINQWQLLAPAGRVGRAVRTLHAIAGALGTFHRFDPPLIHRDMKPQNVLMASGVPRITDFGLGSVVLPAGADQVTGALTALAAQLPVALHAAGTRSYASPEQMRGGPPHPRDDVYALGIIAYQMLVADTKAAPGPDVADELRDLGSPPELVSLVVRSVASKPDRRPHDATEWETTLAALTAKLPKQPGAPDSSEEETRTFLPPADHPAGATDTPHKTAPVPLSLPESQSSTQSDTRPAGRKRFAALALGVLIAALAVLALTLPTNEDNRPAPPQLAPDDGGAQANPPQSKESPQPKPPEPKPPEPKSPAPKSPPPRAGETREVEIANGVKMTFCWIPGGECQLGSPKAERDYVRGAYLKDFPMFSTAWLDKEADAARGKFKTGGFWMGKYEVTQSEWAAVMRGSDRASPSYHGSPVDTRAKGMDLSRFPVECVSWDDCHEFLKRANAFDGILKAFGKPGVFKLPHEDAWEYACRGGLGNDRPFYWGDKCNGTEANVDGRTAFGAAQDGIRLGRTCAVNDTNGGKYAVHPWGLVHMIGNVQEWCDNLQAAPNFRAMRGGGWKTVGRAARSAFRNSESADKGLWDYGLRVIIFGL